MHIPDSAISPVTSLAAGAAMLPVWAGAGRRLRATLGDRQTPLLAIGAAFCFTIMMFNIPVPGGTTVHPTGGVLLAVLLGPAAAVIGMTVALAIQALFFGDGGVLALGANAFTMAFAGPVCGYAVYRLIAAGSRPESPRRALAAGAGAYAGLNVAALLTAVLLGIQPALFHGPDGRPLYFPFGLRVTIPALMAAHLLVAGFAESVVTAAAVRYLRAIAVPLHGQTEAARGRFSALWLGLAVLAAISPLGLLARGEAWGEWSATDLAARAGYTPAGLARIEEHGWKGFNLLPDYLSDHGAWAYVAAAAAGIALIAAASFLIGSLLKQRNEDGSPQDLPASANPPGRIPAWMLAEEPEPGTASTGGGTDYVERTLAGLADGARDALLSEQWSRREGLLQRIDPRVKSVALFGFIVLTAVVHKPGILGLLYVAGLALGLASGLPPRLLLRRVWLAVPLFVGLVTLPAALSVVTPGHPLFTLSRHPLIAVTDRGLSVAALLTFRVGVAVTFALLLTLTTRWDALLGALGALRVPRAFLVVVAMTYRYLAVLMTAASDMFTARKSRTLGRGRGGDHRRFVGGAVGALFGKSVALTEEVHSAMLSRGWTGESRSLDSRALRSSDFAWLAGTLVFAVCLLGGEFLA